MKSIIAALAMLTSTPFILQAKQPVSQGSITGSIQFSGKISAPTCEVARTGGQYISSCYRETAAKTNEFIHMPLDNMTSELMSPPTRERVANHPSLQRITLTYN
jgi:type 1 fimbria pilin